MHILKSFLYEEAPAGGGGGSGGGQTLLNQAPAGAGGAGAGAGGVAGAGGQGGTPAPVVSKTFREGWIGADGKIDKTAYDRLPDHLKPYKDTFAKYDTDEQLLQALGNTVSLNGKKGLLPLPDNASDADKAAFNQRLREVLKVPADAKGYGVEKPADLPDESWNAPFVEGAVSIMHKHNASPALVKELLEFDVANGKKIHGEIAKQQAESLNKARQAIDQAFGAEAPQKMGLARRMAQTVGLDMNDPAIGNNAQIIIALHRMASMVGEDKMVSGSSGGAAGGATDREKARAIIFDKSNELFEAYHDPQNGRHQEALAAVARHNAAWQKAGGK